MDSRMTTAFWALAAILFAYGFGVGVWACRSVKSKPSIAEMRAKNGEFTINQANREARWPVSPWGDEPWLGT
jgi:hypothetical protein